MTCYTDPESGNGQAHTGDHSFAFKLKMIHFHIHFHVIVCRSNDQITAAKKVWCRGVEMDELSMNPLFFFETIDFELKVWEKLLTNST